MLTYEWDPIKAATNIEKHGVTFEESTTVFDDPFEVTVIDPDSPEYRFITIGHSTSGQILVVVYADRGHTIRIISARPATRRERRNYETKRSR